MPQEFKAFVSETRDSSRWIDVEDTRTGETKREEWQKAARFFLESSGPCPWPPSTLLGASVVVFGRSEIIGVLDRMIKALSDYEDDHNFCESNEKALIEGRELLARLTK